MIKFFIKLWELNRPYKGRFLLGIFFGFLNGVAPAVILGTALFVLGIVFPNNQSQDMGKLFSHLPPWLPDWSLNIVAQIKAHLIHVEDWAAAQAKSTAGMMAVVGLIPLVVLLRGVVSYLNSYLMGWVSIRTICDIRAKLFEHLLSLPLSFYTRNSTGELISRTNDLNILQNVMAVSLVTMIQAPVNILTYVLWMLAIDWKLTLLSFVVFPLCIIPISIYSRKGRRASSAIQSELAALSKVMHESFTGSRIIKAYNLEKVTTDDFKLKLRNFISHYMRVVRATETPGPLIEFLGSIGVAGIFLYLRLENDSRLPEMAAFVVPLLLIYAPIKALTRLQSQTTQAQAATQRVFELLDTPNTLNDPPNPVPLRAAGAEIHFDNVSFGYGAENVLHHIQLVAKPGQMVALVGRTGSGKTSLTNLLLRFYDPTEGAIRIGRVDIRNVALRDLRSQIAVVTQEVILFNDTIRNNIACGRPGATPAEVEEAARNAHAHDFIMEKPHGYESGIGEKGVTLSGGQRQRISLARAILKDAPILVLDEATSSLDNESERAVQAALDELMKGRTTLCIAHRLSTVQHADVIVVLDQGRIVQTGRHAELLAQGGIYHKLYHLQFQNPPGAKE